MKKTLLALQTFVKDLGFIFLLIFIYSIFSYDDFQQWPKYHYFRKEIILNLIFYGAFMYIIYVAAIRVIKSHKALVFLSLLAPLLFTLGLALWTLISNSNWTHSVDGQPIYENGHITIFGFFYQMLTPLLMLTLYGAGKVLFTSSYFRRI